MTTTDPINIDRETMARLLRSTRRLIESIQRENSEVWHLARQASIDLSVVEHKLNTDLPPE
jgi:predicted MarR family transcription regulator